MLLEFIWPELLERKPLPCFMLLGLSRGGDSLMLAERWQALQQPEDQ